MRTLKPSPPPNAARAVPHRLRRQAIASWVLLAQAILTLIAAFLGGNTRERKANGESRLRQADLHVCPSISEAESFPNVLLDAKQAGLASVVFPTAGLPEAVTDGVDGLVAERLDATALAAAIARLITSDTLHQTLADGAHGSLARYDADRIVGEWIAIFKEPM